MSEQTEAQSTKDEPYGEDSIAFPTDLSQFRYMAFNFYDSAFTDKLADVAVDLVVYGAKGIGGKVGTSVVAEVTNSASEGASALFGSNNDVSPILKKVAQRAEKAGNETDAQSKQSFASTKKFFSDGVDARNAIETGKFKFAIYLPLVNGFRETITHNWNAEKGLVSETISGLIKPSITKSIQGIGNMFGARTALINPDWVQTYAGTGLRSFVLTWVLMPNTADEAKDIFNIVRKFKRASSAQRGPTGATLLPPLYCNIEFTNPTLESSVRMNEMVVTGMAINYSESGFMETFRDGVPKAISLELQIAERRMKTERDWKPIAKVSDTKYKDENSSLTANLG